MGAHVPTFGNGNQIILVTLRLRIQADKCLFKVFWFPSGRAPQLGGSEESLCGFGRDLEPSVHEGTLLSNIFRGQTHQRPYRKLVAVINGGI